MCFKIKLIMCFKMYVRKKSIFYSNNWPNCYITIIVSEFFHVIYFRWEQFSKELAWYQFCQHFFFFNILINQLYLLIIHYYTSSISLLKPQALSELERINFWTSEDFNKLDNKFIEMLSLSSIYDLLR